MAETTFHRVSGWKLDAEDRRRLLKMFAPLYGHVVADHVTLRRSDHPDDAPPAPRSSEIVGQTSDGEGVQALVVRLDGTTPRPDGGTYHITWSLGSGRRAKESNDVLRERGWTPVEATPVKLKPAVF